MEELTGVLEQLAIKLGTTTEYLWNVLISQARISAITDLIYIILISIIGIIIYKVHKKLMKEEKYDYYEEPLIAVMVIISLVWAILFIAFFFSIGNIINGFLNPEYWALKEVLSVVK